jgi:hypothetical protein
MNRLKGGIYRKRSKKMTLLSSFRIGIMSLNCQHLTKANKFHVTNTHRKCIETDFPIASRNKKKTEKNSMKLKINVESGNEKSFHVDAYFFSTPSCAHVHQVNLSAGSYHKFIQLKKKWSITRRFPPAH